MARAERVATGDPVLVFRETRWSYRRPVSYDIVNPAGERIGHLAPADPRTTTTALLVAGDAPELMLTIERTGDTTVADLHGRLYGVIRWRRPALSTRLRITAGGRDIGAVEMPMLRAGDAHILDANALVVGWIRRGNVARLAGAAWSALCLGPAAGALPGPLLLAAIPALDAARRAIRARRG